jgi:hypothetical protein
MQGLKWTSANGRAVLVARVILGLVLLALVTGLWVCLWVPPGPIL